MVKSVLVDALGESVNLKILSLFIENPFDRFDKSQISRFAGVSRNSVYRYLPEFEEKGYVEKTREAGRDVFSLVRSNRIVELIDRFVEEVGSVYMEPIAVEQLQEIVQKEMEQMGDRVFLLAQSAA